MREYTGKEWKWVWVASIIALRFFMASDYFRMLAEVPVSHHHGAISIPFAQAGKRLFYNHPGCRQWVTPLLTAEERMANSKPYP